MAELQINNNFILAAEEALKGGGCEGWIISDTKKWMKAKGLYRRR